MQPEEKSETKLTPNVLGALCYALPPLTGIYIFVLEKSKGADNSQFVLFHVYQSIMFGVAAYFLFRLTFAIPYSVGYFINRLFMAVAALLWILLIMKAAAGSEFELPYIGKIAKSQSQKHAQ